MRTHRDSVSSGSPPWKPLFEESFGQKLSAPSQWLCAITDIGRRRSRNEDAYFLSPESDLWIVVDGMGGHLAGEVASALTIQAMAESLGTGGPDGLPPAATAENDRLTQALAEAQNRVRARSLSDSACQGMGSTVIAGVLEGETLHVCHVGDARGYHFRQGQLRHFTNDHSLVWELVMCGLLAPHHARLHPHRAIVTQAIGMPAGIDPELTRVVLEPGDRVLFCSDGLWEALSDQDICKIVGAEGSMLELAAMLVNAANEAGGQDNITVVLYEHRGRSASRRQPDVG